MEYLDQADGWPSLWWRRLAYKAGACQMPVKWLSRYLESCKTGYSDHSFRNNMMDTDSIRVLILDIKQSPINVRHATAQFVYHLGFNSAA